MNFFNRAFFTRVMTSTHVNLLNQNELLRTEKSSTPVGLACYTNMAAVTSCENAL